MNKPNETEIRRWTSEVPAATWEPWIQTVSGIKFHYLSGSSNEVVITDIATALSRIPRWSGHTSKFYSVAQHSVLTAILCKERGGNLKQQRLCFIHDTPEGYMMDIPSPLKRMIPKYKEIEEAVYDKISRRFFGRTTPMDDMVKACDSIMLATEARDLFPFKPIDNWVEKRCLPAWDKHIDPIGPTAAYNLFMYTYGELFNAE